MSWGFANTRQSGLAFNVLAGIDIDSHALSTYRRNIQGLAIEQDIRAIAEDPELLTSLVPSFDPTGRPFVFLGCPPCQGFSAHRRKDVRDDPRNNLVLSFSQICARWLPDVVVLENVPEMLAGRYQSYYEAARTVLEDAGYDIAAEVLDLSLFGVPQRRRRSIVIATRDFAPRLPVAPLRENEVRTVREAIGHLASQSSGGRDRVDPWHRSPSHIPRILELIKAIPPDGGDRRSLPEDLKLECHKELDKGKTPGFWDVYGRLRWDAPAVTITAKSSTPSCGRFLHPEQHRNISVREAALLQGFPHNFVFDGPFINQYRQIGEAVPPAFASHLAAHVLGLIRPPNPVAINLQARLRAPKHANIIDARSDVASTVRAVDVFCGAGGLSLGLAAAGLTHALGVDLDEDAVATYAKNVSADVICDDVSDPRVADEIARAVAGSTFVIAGGPPCQGFSQQRRGDNRDDRNDLVLEYARLVESISHRPSAVVLENVTYLDSPRGRRVMADYVARLSSLGYVVQRHDLNSADFGVPQLRRRIVLVALAPEVAPHYGGPVPLTADRFVTIGEALAGLPTGADPTIPNHVSANESAINTRRIAYVDMGRGRLAIPESLQLQCHRGYDGHLDVYGRLNWLGQARTITGGFDSASRGEYAHPFRNRSITAREAARIQGFPDWFSFEGNRAAVRRQIGNAVPPPLGYAIGRAVLDAITVASHGTAPL